MLDFALRGVVARFLGSYGPQADGVQSRADGPRMGRNGELYAIQVCPDMGTYADEGSYFCVNNAQTGIATLAAPVSFAATSPFLMIFNKDSQPNGRRISLDYMTLVCTAAGTAGTSLQCAVTIDQGNRYTSGGTEITANIANPNFDAANSSIARVWAGAIVATAASSTARNVVGNRYLKGTIPAVADTYTLKFGGVDAPTVVSSAASLYTSQQNVAKVMVGPQESALIYLWLPSQSVASSYLPELGWIER